MTRGCPRGCDFCVSLLVRLWVEISTFAIFCLSCQVSLLVRLWVEIWHKDKYQKIIPSASLWGCELKFLVLPNLTMMVFVSLLVRLWVEIKAKAVTKYPYLVSLLVRLWVEMQPDLWYRSAVLVSLLVRLWVEMVRRLVTVGGVQGQPPCEAVSWNFRYANRTVLATTSASLWGCELKYHWYFLSLDPIRQPPCEAVSWNSIASPFESTSCSSASLSFEMPFWLCYNRHDISQSLWETVNWKEEYAVIVVSARKLTSILLEEDCEINHSHI